MKIINQIGSVILLIATLSCSKSDNKTVNLQSNCLPTNLQNGVIAFYPFSNGSINDFSGNNHNLTNSTTANSGEDRSGNPNCAFNFVAANGDFLKHVNPTFLNDIQNGPFSISIWYNSLDVVGNLLTRGNISGNCRGGFGEWSLVLYDGNAPSLFINSYRIIGTPLDGSLQINEWHHLVVTCNISDLKVYQDGVLIEDSENVACASPASPSLNIGDLYLGENLTGKLDDVIIYNRLLSQTEISQLYNLPTCCQ